MLNIIISLFDRCIFTITFIIGIQLPEFMQQYLQRASGHLDEAQHQLAQFSSIANIHFDGDLTLMIKQYKVNAEQSIVHTGNAIEQLVNRVAYLENHLATLQEADFIKRLYNFFIHIDLPIAQATLKQYQLAIPLELTALTTGLFIAIMPIFVNTLLSNLIKLAVKPKRANKY